MSICTVVTFDTEREEIFVTQLWSNLIGPILFPGSATEHGIGQWEEPAGIRLVNYVCISMDAGVEVCCCVYSISECEADEGDTSVVTAEYARAQSSIP